VTLDFVGNCGDSAPSDTALTNWAGKQHLYDYFGGAGGGGSTVVNWRGSEYLQVNDNALTGPTLEPNGHVDFLAAYVRGGVQITKLNWGVVDSGLTCSLHQKEQHFSLDTHVLGVDAGGRRATNAVRLSLAAIDRPASQAVFRVDLYASLSVKLDIFDLSGRRVAVLANGLLPRGVSSIVWKCVDRTGAGVRSGVYFARLLSPAGKQSVPVVVVR